MRLRVFIILALLGANLYGAAAVVQAKTCQNPAQTTSWTCTFNSTPTTGNTIVVGGAFVNGGTFAITDNKGNSYTSLGTLSGNCAGACSQLFATANITSSATFTVTVTGSGSGFQTLMMVEYSGMPSALKLDGYSQSNGNSANPTCRTTSSNSHDVVISVMSFRGTGAAMGIAATSPFTLETAGQAGLNNGMPGGYADDITSGTSGDFTAAFTTTQGSTNYSCSNASLVATIDALSYPLVQKHTNCFGGTGNIASFTCTFFTTPSTSNKIVVAASAANGSVTGLTVTDNQSNSYTNQAILANGTNSTTAAIACASGISSSGTFTVTVTPTGNVGRINIAIFEIGGLTSCTPDKTATATNTATNTFPCGSMTTTHATDYLISVMVGTNATDNIGFTASSGYTLEGANNFGSVSFPFAVMDRFVTSTGTFTPQFTGTDPSEPYACASAALGGTGQFVSNPTIITVGP